MSVLTLLRTMTCHPGFSGGSTLKMAEVSELLGYIDAGICKEEHLQPMVKGGRGPTLNEWAEFRGAASEQEPEAPTPEPVAEVEEETPEPEPGTVEEDRDDTVASD